MLRYWGWRVSVLAAFVTTILAPASAGSGTGDSVQATGEFIDHQTGAHNTFFLQATESGTGSGEVTFHSAPFVVPGEPDSDLDTIFPLGILRIHTQFAGPEEVTGVDAERQQARNFEQTGPAVRSFVRIS